MNGRALNERAIEVSPSSNRVLERAAEILTPFPPSKNRPRPGDWTCPSCGFSNFQRRTACFRCSYPAISHPPADQSIPGYSYGYPPPMMAPPFGHDSGVGGRARGMGGSAPFRPGDWRCGQPECLYHNFAKNVTCLRCGSSRANALTHGPQDFGYNMHPVSFDTGHPGAPAIPSGPGGPMNPPAGFSANAAAAFQGGPAFAPTPGYGLPSGLGGPGGYAPMSGFPPNGVQPATGFDSRAAEAAFSGAGSHAGPGAAPGPPVGGASSFSNGGASFDGGADPFGFLGTGLGSLSLDDNRRNGAHGPAGKN
jgi:Zn-finger in Ran binding protein and others